MFYSQPTNFNDPLDCMAVVKQDSDKSTLGNILAALMGSRVEHEILRSLKIGKVAGDGAAKHAKRHAD